MSAETTEAGKMISVTPGGSIAAGGVTTPEWETLYDALGVSENATLEEIKQAYYQLVRQFRPADHPETFQKFAEASRTLTDARRRGEYDQHRRSGRRVQILMDQAAVSLDRDAQKAVALLKNAIQLAPDMPRPRHLLAHVLMKIEDYALAEKQYRWLLKEYPRDESLYFRIARCQFLQEQYDISRNTLTKLLSLNPRYHDGLILLARLEERVGNLDRAVEIFEKAIANDNRETFADLDAFLRLLVIHFQRDDSAAQISTTARLLRILPTDDSEKATQVVQQLILRAVELEETGSYHAARGLLEVAGKIPNADTEKRTEASVLHDKFMLSEDAKHLADDTLVHGALKECLLIKYQGRAMDGQRASRMEAAVSALQASIIADPRGLQQALLYVQHEYPRIAADYSQLLEELTVRINRRLELLENRETMVMRDPVPTVATEESASEKPERKGFLGIFRRK